MKNNIKSANLPEHYIKYDYLKNNKSKVIEFIKFNFRDCNAKTEDFVNELFDIYLEYHLSDQKLSFNEIRRKILIFNKNLTNVLADIEDIKGVVLTSIFDFEIRHHDILDGINRDRIGEISVFRDRAKTIKLITDRMLKVRSGKTPINRVYEACKIIIKFYETAVGREFSHNTTAPTGPTIRDKTNRQFKNPDAQFVKSLLQTVDPELTFTMIQTGLKRTLRDRAKQI